MTETKDCCTLPEDPAVAHLALMIGAMLRTVCAPLEESAHPDDISDGRNISTALGGILTRTTHLKPEQAAKFLRDNPVFSGSLPNDRWGCMLVYESWEQVGRWLRSQAQQKQIDHQSSPQDRAMFSRAFAAMESVRDWYEVRALITAVLVRHDAVSPATESHTLPPGMWTRQCMCTFRQLVASYSRVV